MILEGLSVLLIAPTASGKTEAYGAPLAERILSDPGPLSACIVSPTRALVNDLARRIEPPMASLGLRIGRRTGEYREIAGTDPPHLVITTPESLDSLLARTPRNLRGVRHLVLDEIHMLAGSPRGDQLACCVSRLRALCPQIQGIASSATVEDPQELGLRYLGPGFRVVEVPGLRPIETIWTGESPLALADTLRRMAAEGRACRKVLVFTGSRADAERFTARFKGRPPFGDAVFVHHGSLSRTTREKAEARMLTGETGICFATTTLEVGIDIGDMDLVVLAAPPPDVASLLQRIGRGCRRTSATRVCCMVGSKFPRIRYEHLLVAARRGDLLGAPHRFCPSVLAQQCLSLLMQSPNRWITPQALASRMPGWLASTGWLRDLPELLDRLSEKGWLRAGKGRYGVGDRLEDAFLRGRIHSNIEAGPPEVDLVDKDTLQVLGSLPLMATEGGTLHLGGRRLAIAGKQGPSRVLVTDTGAGANLTIQGKGPSISGAVARDLAMTLGLGPSEAPLLTLKDGSMALFHFLGDPWGALVGVLLEAMTRTRPLRTHAFFARVATFPEGFPPSWDPAMLEALAVRNWRRLRERVSEGPWAHTLPASWRTRHLLACLDLPRFRETLLGLTIRPRGPPHREDPLGVLALSLGCGGGEE